MGVFFITLYVMMFIFMVYLVLYLLALESVSIFPVFKQGYSSGVLEAVYVEELGKTAFSASWLEGCLLKLQAFWSFFFFF